MAYKGFIALDESIEKDLRLLSSQGMVDLVDRCRGGVAELPPGLKSEFASWREGLDILRMGKYCGAIASLFRELLVKSGQDPETAAGSIQDPHTAPWFETFAAKGSALASDASVEDGRVVYSTEAIGHHVGVHVGEQPYFGEIAWRSVAPCLAECPFPSLPGLEVRAQPSQVLEVRLAFP
jgi:hypothetical protein